MKQRWDIFCDVVDNYGDIGVCWRLARQLAAEYPITVRLWINHLDTARKLIPGLITDNQSVTPSQAVLKKNVQPSQCIDGVEICHWADEASFDETLIADVVVEAFACDLPHAYVTAMTRAHMQPVWVNLEYLSAESWVDEYHGQFSIHPANGLKKHFFFPGFTERTGGLIREQTLVADRDAYQQSVTAQDTFWRELCLESEASNAAIKLSLFCYPHAPVIALLDSMAYGDVSCLCVVPQGVLEPEMLAYFGIGNTDPAAYSKGKLTLKIIPFLSQQDYDRLLWSCDINFVRGEDSWVRAIWAGKPFIWQPYHQEEDAHLTKLQAFLNVYRQSMHTAWQSWVSMHLKWSSEKKDHAQIDQAYLFKDFQSVLRNIEQLKQGASLQSQQLVPSSDLAARLVSFCRNRV